MQYFCIRNRLAILISVWHEQDNHTGIQWPRANITDPSCSFIVRRYTHTIIVNSCCDIIFIIIIIIYPMICFLCLVNNLYLTDYKILFIDMKYYKFFLFFVYQRLSNLFIVVSFSL